MRITWSRRDAFSLVEDNSSESNRALSGRQRQRFEGTYQHCLLVTGVAIDFGLSLGLRKADLERLYSAAMFHDIGKAKIPVAILDKPGRLDSTKQALIASHPAAGHCALKGTAGISTEVLDAVLHHHEYLAAADIPTVEYL